MLLFQNCGALAYDGTAFSPADGDSKADAESAAMADLPGSWIVGSACNDGGAGAESLIRNGQGARFGQRGEQPAHHGCVVEPSSPRRWSAPATPVSMTKSQQVAEAILAKRQASLNAPTRSARSVDEGA